MILVTIQTQILTNNSKKGWKFPAFFLIFSNDIDEGGGAMFIAMDNNQKRVELYGRDPSCDRRSLLLLSLS